MIHFDSIDATKKVLDSEDHMIEGHALDIRCARNFSPTFETATIQCNIMKSSKKSLNVRKLLIKNLHKSTTSKTLEKYFGKYGKVLDAYVPTVYGKNQSRNFGYIIMNSENVTFNFHGHHIDGTNVLIEDDRSILANELTKTILISASPPVMDELSTDQLIKFFAKFGNIISCRKPTDPCTKKSSHYAFIEYSNTSAVEDAMKNFAYMIDGKLVCITKSRHDQKK
jgi:RNA recognition motif-containing protein